MFDLKGKIGMVTRGTRGIGKAAVAGRKEFGAQPIVIDTLCEKSQEEREAILFLRCEITQKGHGQVSFFLLEKDDYGAPFWLFPSAGGSDLNSLRSFVI